MPDDRFRGLIIDIEICVLATRAASRQPDYPKKSILWGNKTYQLNFRLYKCLHEIQDAIPDNADYEITGQKALTTLYSQDSDTKIK